MAASVKASPSGRGQSTCCGMTTYSAKAPSRRYSSQDTPSTRRWSHRLISPRRQCQQSPQNSVESKVTRVPTGHPCTSSPTAAITPAASCPMMRGGIRRPVLPSRPWRSLPQMPQALTCTSTSRAARGRVGRLFVAEARVRLEERARSRRGRVQPREGALQQREVPLLILAEFHQNVVHRRILGQQQAPRRRCRWPPSPPRSGRSRSPALRCAGEAAAGRRWGRRRACR